MLTKADIDWMKSEIVPALSDQVKKDVSTKLDWIATMLDKQSGNLQSIQTEIVLIRGLLETNASDQKMLKKHVSTLEQKLQMKPAVS